MPVTKASPGDQRWPAREWNSGWRYDPAKRRCLPDTPEGRLQDPIETAKAHIRSKGEHPFRVIKQPFGFHKSRLRGLAKNRCKINLLTALTNLFLAWRLLATG